MNTPASRTVLIVVTAEYTISGGDDTYKGAQTWEDAVEIDRQAIADGTVGVVDVLDWANEGTVQVTLSMLLPKDS